MLRYPCMPEPILKVWVCLLVSVKIGGEDHGRVNAAYLFRVFGLLCDYLSRQRGM